nr:NAD-dependent epimerase/dehydratase family protein [Kibdelosporangium phytohabitans]
MIPGGTGHIGRLLSRALTAAGHDVVVLSRGRPSGIRSVQWDGRALGVWTDEIDGCDAVINLAGRGVNCRYNGPNLRAMMDSRVDSARVVGEAIQRAAAPPRVWLRMSTATIYAHSLDVPPRRGDGSHRWQGKRCSRSPGLQRGHRQGVGEGATGHRHIAHAQGRAEDGDGDEP